MIVTLTLNPAIDRTVEIEALKLNGVNHVNRTKRDAAGKGINVGKVLDRLGFSATLTGFLAGQNGQFIRNNLCDLKLNHHFIDVPGETRENLKVWQTSTQSMIELNEQGPSFDQEAYDRLERYLIDVLKPGDWLVLSGSLPKGSPKTIYQQLIKRVKVNGVMTVLDASNEALFLGLEAHPTVIKPNREELETLAGKALPTLSDIATFLNDPRFEKIEEIYVTLGAQGALAKKDTQTLIVEPLTLITKSTVGAGDSFVAGLMVAKAKGQSFEACLRFASATASAATLTEGTQAPSAYDVQTMLERMTIKPYQEEGV